MKRCTYFVLLFTFCLINGKLLFSDGGVGVQVFMQSPKTVQRHPGEMFTAAYFVENTSEKQDTFVSRLKAPDGWETIPSPLPTLSLKKGDRRLQIFGIKIPKFTPPGNYQIYFEVQGTSSPQLLGQAQMTVVIESVQKVEAKVSQRKNTIYSGKSYEVDLTLENLGNKTVNLEIDPKSSLDNSIKVLPSKKVTLKPGEIRQVTLKVKTYKELYVDRKDFVQIAITDANTHKQLTYVSSITQVFSSKSHVQDVPKYHYIPATATFVSGFENGKKSLFVNLEGHGSLNKEETEKLSFLVRVPVIQHTNVYRQLGGTPEKYFLNYQSPHFHIYGGDGVYQLTPLTMTSRYGNGGYLSLKTPKVQVGSLAAIHSSSVPQTDVGVFFKLLPHEYFSLQSSYYRADGRLAEQRLEGKNKADIYSLDAIYTYKDNVSLQGEWAYSHLETGDKSDQGFYLNGFWSPNSIININFQKIYAPKHFYGYYNNQSQGSASLTLTPYKRLSLIGSYNVVRTNLSNTPEFLTANKYKRYLAEATYTFPKGIFLSGSYNGIKINDQINNSGYSMQYGALRFSQSYKQWSLLLNGEYGLYTNHSSPSIDKAWQNYQAYLYFRLSGQTFNVYGRWGSIAQVDEITWNQTYGATYSIFIKPVKFKIDYEKNLKDSLPTKDYIYGKFSYEFKNKSTLDVYGNVLMNFDTPNIYRMLFSYTLPFGIPVKKNIYRTQVKGKVYIEDHGIIKPSAGSILTLNNAEQRAKKSGSYSFDYLKEGDYYLDIEGLEEGLITERPFPEKVSVKASQIIKKDVIVKKASKLNVNIGYYRIEDETTEKNYKYLFDKSALASIKLINESTGEMYEKTADQEGDIFFDTLRPGLWSLEVMLKEKSNNYKLEEKNFTLELSAGETYHKTIRILPVVRKLKMID